MGVQGLWELLAPVGRRVSVETLAGKKLAIDASIWMIQFMKAMRDEKGEMVRNAHILGFFRRICKLLFLRTKPVFVFDGGTPALKRRTVIARRRQRENAQAKIRKTAEKLLLNHLKAMKLKELAEEIKNQKQKNNSKGEKGLPNQNDNLGINLDKTGVASRTYSQEKLDEMLAASIAAEEGRNSTNNASTSSAGLLSEGEDGDEEIILPAMHGKVDHTVLAALPESMQHNLLAQLGEVGMKKASKDLENHNNDKGKKVLLDHSDMLGSDNSDKDGMVSRNYNQEKLDEMLAASIAAEEDHGLANNASASAAAIYSEDYDDEDEEMIVPIMHGKVDPAVLAALPPSMQLDLLGQMRERLMAENRQKYQKVKKAPAKFSELQIEAYLKTVAFRREIDEVQKSAAGRGVGGVQTSRIASEANREFIFSSSFTGDKQELASAGVEKHLDKQQQTPMQHPSTNFLNNVASSSKSDSGTGSIPDNFVRVVASFGGEKGGDKQQQTPMEHPSTDFLKNIASTSNSGSVAGSAPDKPRRNFDDDVETYVDERGRLRVSRVRAMGIRMTRDLQRNLDLMKEVEQERNANKIVIPESIPDSNENNVPKILPTKDQLVETSYAGNDESVNVQTRNEQSMFKGETAIEISFKDDDVEKCFDGDDELFARLVAGDPIAISSAENISPEKQSSDSASDCDWEEGHIEGEADAFSNDAKAEIKSVLKEGSISDDSEVEWEEDDCDVLRSTSSCCQGSQKAVSRGSLEEDASLQEAIRRSLDDLKDKKLLDAFLENENLEYSGKDVYEGVGSLDGNNVLQSHTLGANVIEQIGSLRNGVDESGNSNGVGGINASVTFDSPGTQLNSLLVHNADNTEISTNNQCQNTGSHSEILQDTNKSVNLFNREMPCLESATPLETNETDLISEELLDAYSERSGMSPLANRSSRGDPHISHAVSGSMPNVTRVDDKENDMESEPSHPVLESTNLTIPVVGSSTKESTIDIDVEKTLAGETNDNYSKAREPSEEKYAMDNGKMDFEATEATLEEEMLILAEERINLGDEQRKLERNAESVSSEMFSECQELLQMFGLPYIIAPMEAEAQCAYMELANLVDGVVTDDSDVFLFGARSVYKNIFDDRKYVETYFMKDIENELGLTREKLMRMAMLLGSDYTEGISGIGIVNAIEVVNAFPEEDGLHKFREWVESPDPTILGKFNTQTGPGSRKRGAKVSEKGFNKDVSEAHEHEPSLDCIEEEKKIFMDKHRNVSKNWYIPYSFPSEAVISAYASPQVDKSTEPFSWGKPDLSLLRRLCWEKFGWGSGKADDLLLPVLKEYNKHETQLRLEAFYTFNERFAKIRSKRIKKAVKGITGNQSSALMDDAMQEVSKSRKKRRLSPNGPGDKEPEKLSEEMESIVAKSDSKQSRKRKINPDPSEVENLGPLMLARRGLSTRKELKGNVRGRGRGRGAGRGRKKKGPGFESSETSSSDVNGGNDQEMDVQKLEGPCEVRRSARPRKQASYVLNDMDTEDVGEMSDYRNEKSSDKEVVAQESSWLQDTCGDDGIGPVEKEQHKAGDPSLEEESCRDYLEAGGGFCMDEDEIGQQNVSPNGDPSFEGELSGDYLKMGGGFCLDEDERDKDRDAAYISDTVVSQENADPDRCSGIMGAVNQDVPSGQSLSSPKRAINVLQDGGSPGALDTEQNLDHQTASSKDDTSKVGVPLQDNAKDDTGTISVGVLRAMPSLRRKRRKG